MLNMIRKRLMNTNNNLVDRVLYNQLKLVKLYIMIEQVKLNFQI
jgi:hypothetical protein